MAVEFRLLGDIELCVGGHIADIGHARQRCVLVALLVDANRAVPADQLVDRVWADQPPQRARATLSGYLSRLRQILAPADEARIVRQPGGYLLTVDPMAVDLHRFHRLIAQARAAGDKDSAVAGYERALGLWRGEAFATLDTPWVNSVRVALDAERLVAELDRNDLALDAGRHAALLGELTRSAIAHPLDERLAGQLMLARYRCGRQADALEHYQQLRLRLADELGADPSPPLQRLHQQILTADPALAARTLTGSALQSAGSSVPRQLPAPLRSFVGRADELAELDALLAAADQQPAAMVVSALGGTAGVGKTTLAVQWAHRVADRFGDGQLYVNLRGFDPGGSMMTPAEALRGFLDALQVPPKRIPVSLDAQAALYRSLLAGRRMLVVLDNARDADQVRPLLPGSPGCLVVVTSRNRLPGLIATEDAHPLPLDLFTHAEARELLVHRLGADRVAAEPQAADEVITRCARLPLALAVVASRAATNPDFPLAALADELRHTRHGLDALDGGEALADVRAVFSWSYHILSPAAARLFRRLGWHPGPDISAAAAASLTGTPQGVQPVLAELARAHLVTEHSPGRYALHDLLRAYATEMTHAVDSPAERRAAAHQALDHYLHTGCVADRLLYPPRDPINLAQSRPGVTPEDLTDRGQALAWFIAEHRVLLAAVEQAASDGFEVHAWQLAWTLWDYLNLQGYLYDQLAVQRTALSAARRLGDRSGQAHAHRCLGRTHDLLGRYADAQTHLGHALDLFGELGDRPGEAQTHTNLARLLSRQGLDARALRHDLRSLDLYRAAGHRAGQARVLNNLGWDHAQRGEHQQALTYCQQSVALNQEIGNRHGEGTAWDSLGYVHHHLGQYRDAAACYQRALALFQETEDRYYEADTLAHLGDTRFAAGDSERARDPWRRALVIFEEIDHPDAGRVRAKLNHLDHITV